MLTGHGIHDGQRDQALALADGRFTVLTAFSLAGAAAKIPLLAGGTGAQSRP